MLFLGVVFAWDKNFFSKSCKIILNAHFLENKFSNKLSLGLCRLVLSRLLKYRAVDLSSRPHKNSNCGDSRMIWLNKRWILQNKKCNFISQAFETDLKTFPKPWEHSAFFEDLLDTSTGSFTSTQIEKIEHTVVKTSA
jgi:hypothetical protein